MATLGIEFVRNLELLKFILVLFAGVCIALATLLCERLYAAFERWLQDRGDSRHETTANAYNSQLAMMVHSMLTTERSIVESLLERLPSTSQPVATNCYTAPCAHDTGSAELQDEMLKVAVRVERIERLLLSGPAPNSIGTLPVADYRLPMLRSFVSSRSEDFVLADRHLAKMIRARCQHVSDELARLDESIARAIALRDQLCLWQPSESIEKETATVSLN